MGERSNKKISVSEQVLCVGIYIYIWERVRIEREKEREEFEAVLIFLL